jgi:hypothetical protein
MEKAERVPKSMFSADRQRSIELSGREHEEFQR